MFQHLYTSNNTIQIKFAILNDDTISIPNSFEKGIIGAEVLSIKLVGALHGSQMKYTALQLNSL